MRDSASIKISGAVMRARIAYLDLPSSVLQESMHDLVIAWHVILVWPIFRRSTNLEA
jgi:hypothetical protein